MSYILPICGAISAVIAAMMLIVNFRNAQATRRDRENDSIVEIWTRYETICVAIADAKTGKAKDLAFGRMVNYIENTCFLINRNRLTPNLQRTSQRMVSDFLESLEKHAPLENVLLKIDDAPHAFSEIREFIRLRHNASRFAWLCFWRKDRAAIDRA